MEPFSLDDFDDLDFKDPISLLAAIKNLSAQSQNAACSVPRLLSAEDLQRDYGLSADYIRTALLAGSVKPAQIVLYFSKEDAERLSSEATAGNPLVTAFIKELDKMAMNYSYKPLLLLALLETDTLSRPIDEITEFYLDYYRRRSQTGLVIEKDDSAFVQNEDNFIIAKRTILRYPVSVLSKKAFVVYEQETGIVRLNNLLTAYVGSKRERIRQQCYDLLEKYYDSLL